MSLGGATGVVGFSSDSQAESLADQVWDMFLGGQSDTRPFGDAVLDGFVSSLLFSAKLIKKLTPLFIT